MTVVTLKRISGEPAPGRGSTVRVTVPSAAHRPNAYARAMAETMMGPKEYRATRVERFA